MQASKNTTLFLMTLFLGLFANEFLNAQDFEGEIVFTKHSLEDTSYYAYKIKGNKVRIDELDSKQNLINYMLVDVDEKSVYAISPKRKLYVKMPAQTTKHNTDSAYTVIKSVNNKSINGYKCYQWRVRNNKENSEITYWVSDQHFEYFSDLLHLLNREEKSSVYYLQIPDSQGFFPLLSEERSLLRELRMSLKVTNIEKKKLSADLFEIPANFKLFQKN